MPSSSGIRSTWLPSSSNSSRKAIPYTRVTSRTCGPRAMPISMSMGNITLTWRRDGDVRDYGHSVSLEQYPLSAKNFSITTGKRIALLEVIHLDHQREPDFPGCGLRCVTLVLEPSKVFGLKPTNPQGDGGTGHLQ